MGEGERGENMLCVCVWQPFAYCEGHSGGPAMDPTQLLAVSGKGGQL